MEALLAYVDVPPDCRDAIPLLNLENQAFAKVLKRMLKKLEKGETSVQKQLPNLSNDGNEEDSDYLFIGTSQEESSNILFARLPDSTGGNEIYRLPFLRFFVRKANQPEKVEVKDDVAEVKKHNNETNVKVEPCLENTIKNLNDKIDNFGTQLSKLLESLPQHPPKPSRPPRPRKSGTPAAAAKTTTAAAAPNTPNATGTPKSTPTAKPTPTPKATPTNNKPKTPVTPAASSQLKPTPNKSTSVHFPSSPSNNQMNESKSKPKKKPTTESSTTTVNASGDHTNTNTDGMSTIDSAIDKILSRINKGKDIDIGIALQERLSACINGKEMHSSSSAAAMDYTVDIDSSPPPSPPPHVVEEYRCPVALPKRNLVAIAPSVSFTVKPVQSSAPFVPPPQSTKRNHSSMMQQEQEEEDGEEENNGFVSRQDDCAIVDVQSSGEKKRKHKKRKHTED